MSSADLDEALSEALVYRTRTGAPALSFDEGTLIDPGGRKVQVGPVWGETEEDPEEIWDDLTEPQQRYIRALVSIAQVKYKTMRERDEALEEMLQGVRTIERPVLPGDGLPLMGSQWCGEE